MKIKKLVVGIVASALIVASMATTAFAATSPKTEDVTPTTAPSKPSGKPGGSGRTSSPSKTSDVIDVDALAADITGDVIKYDGVDLDPTIPADLYKLTKDIIEKAKAQGAGKILKAVDAEDSSDHNGKGKKYQDTITVRFHSKAFKAGMKITVFHLADGQDKFEKITPDSVTDGECIVTFTSLSPVIFAVEGTSDKTGETAPILPIAAAICLAGIVFFGTKIRFAK
jgi:hypothetical protein